MNNDSTSYKIDMISPCTKNWEKMTPTEKGRFCKLCKKEVVNLVGLDKDELNKIVSQQQNNFCGRVEAKHLNSIATIKRNWFNRVAASILIGLGLTGLFAKTAKAQVIDASKMNENDLQKLGINENKNAQSKNYIKVEGLIKDNATREGIPFVKISFTSNDKIVGEVITDFNGNFSLYPLNASFDSVIDISILYLGYDSLHIKNLHLNKNDVFIDLGLQGGIRTLKNYGQTDEIGVVGGITATPSYDESVQFQDQSVPASTDKPSPDLIKQNNVPVQLGPAH